MVGEDTFYEGADDRDAAVPRARRPRRRRRPGLDRAVPAAGCAPRRNLRSAVGRRRRSRRARAHGRRRHRRAPGRSSRRPCSGADEPGEALAYWLGRYGRACPKPVKRGVADAVGAALRRAQPAQVRHRRGDAVRFGDVLDLDPPGRVDAGARATCSGTRSTAGTAGTTRSRQSLPMLRERAELMALPVEQRRALTDPAALRRGRHDVGGAAGWRQGELDAAAWDRADPDAWGTWRCCVTCATSTRPA